MAPSEVRATPYGWEPAPPGDWNSWTFPVAGSRWPRIPARVVGVVDGVVAGRSRSAAAARQRLAAGTPSPSCVFRSRLPILLVPNRSKNGTSFELSMMPYGLLLADTGTRSILPVFGSSVPTKPPRLHGEDDQPASRKHEAVRIARFRIRHLVLGHVGGLHVDLADQARRVARVPELPSGSSTRPCGPEFAVGSEYSLKASGRRIQVADDIRQLSGVPDGSVARRRRVVWKRPRARRHPLVELHLDDIGERRRRISMRPVPAGPCRPRPSQQGDRPIAQPLASSSKPVDVSSASSHLS